MNKTSSIILTIIVIILLAGAIVYAFVFKGDTDNVIPVQTATTTTTTTTTTTGTVVTASKPIAVTNNTVLPTETTAIVQGTVNPKGAFTSYWYEYGLSSSLGEKTSNQTLGSGNLVISAPGYIVNLTKSTTYFFRLVAENQMGRVIGSTFSFQTTVGTPPPLGSAPTVKTVAVTGLGRTNVNLNGEVTANKTETQYWFEYGKTPELGNTSAFSSAGSGSAKTSVSISLSDLAPLTTYYYRLNTQNQFGTVNGSILNFKTTAPLGVTTPKVVSLNVTKLATTTATLNGTVNPSNAETKYWFEYGTESSLSGTSLNTTDEFTIPTGGNVTNVSVDVSGLDSNTTYYYRLNAQNILGTISGDKKSFKTK